MPTRRLAGIFDVAGLQASHRKVSDELSSPEEVTHEHENPEPLTPGEFVTLEVSLTPTANLFGRGHRMLLEIGSRPDLLHASPFEGFMYVPHHAPPYPARNTVLHGVNHTSYIEVRVRKD